MYDTILVPVDGSEPANRAAEHAMDVASKFDADLHAMYVVDTQRYGGVSGGDDVLEELAETGREVLEDLAGRADVEVTTEIRRGRPSDEITAYADAIEADLVVLGNRGMGAPPEGELGSIAERVVRNAGRPVITA